MNSRGPREDHQGPDDREGDEPVTAGTGLPIEKVQDPRHPGKGGDVVVELERGQVHAAEREERGPQEGSSPRQGIGSAEEIQTEPAEKGVDEIVKLERREKRQNEV